MVKRVIPFSPPDMSEDEINEVADTLRNGWITTGPKVKEFERDSGFDWKREKRLQSY